MSIATLEQQIVAEYGAVKGWIATHVYTSVLLAFGAGCVVGGIFF